MSTVIQVENVSKAYRLGLIGGGTLRDDLARWWARTRGRPDPLLKLGEKDHGNRDGETIWALRDVSFEVKQGEILGIIGRNGAGKSTLLKILSQVTAPTTGQVKVKGRIASLLEVGTGFHPELTGRENIFLNGAILGMTKAEIARKLDEIIAFAEVEQFIDTPVKRYSSGMYVRLAFAVAAHLDPEILIVDEVLAVGDAAFQTKCLGKMGDVARGGRTVLFVSHSMAAVQRLCTRALVLSKGRAAADCLVGPAVAKYLGETDACSQVGCWTRTALPQSPVFIEKVWLSDEAGCLLPQVTTSARLRMAMEFTVGIRCRGLMVGLCLLDSLGEQIFGSAPQDWGLGSPEGPGRYRGMMLMPPDMLLPKAYGVRAILWHPQLGVLDSVDAPQFTVSESMSLANETPGGRGGVLAIRCEWTLAPVHPVVPLAVAAARPQAAVSRTAPHRPSADSEEAR